MRNERGEPEVTSIARLGRPAPSGLTSGASAASQPRREDGAFRGAEGIKLTASCRTPAAFGTEPVAKGKPVREELFPRLLVRGSDVSW